MWGEHPTLTVTATPASTTISGVVHLPTLSSAAAILNATRPSADAPDAVPLRADGTVRSDFPTPGEPLYAAEHI